MVIPDTLWASLQAIATQITGVSSPPPSVGPAVYEVKASVFGGPPYTVTFHPLDGSPAVLLTVGQGINLLPSASGLPVTITYQPGIGGAFDIILSVMIDATQVQGARVLGISPSPDGKVTEIDFYIPASKQILVLHVAAVPSGMSADLKSYSF
jgi:hypothetical protein